jgi:taurine dioxygenase
MTSTDISGARAQANMPGGLPTKPLSRALGAEILGVDLSAPLSDAAFAQIERIWHENLVIALRDQHLSENDQLRFARRFGPLSTSHTRRFNTDSPSVMLISNIRENGKPIGALPDGEMHFHTDQCHQEKPAKGSMLYAIEIPSEGGNTLFANCYAAFEALAPEIKAQIEGRKAFNAYDYDAASSKRGSKVREGVPHYAHPIVRTHPVTKRKALYVNRLMTVSIEGMREDESDALLNFLFDHQEQSQFVYEHVWRVNDLVLWDNRCTLHARTDFSANERRLLRRVVIAGEKPV